MILNGRTNVLGARLNIKRRYLTLEKRGRSNRLLSVLRHCVTEIECTAFSIIVTGKNYKKKTDKLYQKQQVERRSMSIRSVKTLRLYAIFYFIYSFRNRRARLNVEDLFRLKITLSNYRVTI